MDENKLYDPREPVSITLPMEQWRTVLSWMDYGRCYHDAKKWECMCNIKDKATAGRMSADHEKAGEEADRIYKIIDESIIEPYTQDPLNKGQTGEWIWDEHQEIDFNGFRCSKCGQKFNHKYYANVCEFKYCPHCGKPMNVEDGY